MAATVNRLEIVERRLAAAHGTPRLGNPLDPVDDLVYIVLARASKESAYQSAFAALKRHFCNWDSLLIVPRSEVEGQIRHAGLAEKKTETIYEALSLLSRQFGGCTLEPARGWSTRAITQMLCSIPGIQTKTAFCILMYSMDRPVFPVDAHVARVFRRMDLLRPEGPALARLSARRMQFVLPQWIPPHLCYGLHVNLVAHGRSICRAKNPRCEHCVVADFCSIKAGSGLEHVDDSYQETGRG